MRLRAWLFGVACCALVQGALAQERPVDTAWHAEFAHGAVAADHPVASEAGAAMLRLGGNAVDAAVATSFALSVVRPHSCGIGGGGFMVIYLPDDPTHGRVVTAINYRETAPGASRPDMFETSDLPDVSTRSGLAVAVPGTVAGLLHALERYGTLDRATVMAPAIAAAAEGFEVEQTYAGAARQAAGALGRDGEKGRAGFWRDVIVGGEAAVGDMVRNPQQAATLLEIANHGRDGFYRGEVAERIVASAAAQGGVLTLDDLAGFVPVEVEPLEFSFAGRTLLAMPPPSSGGVTMCAAMGILERLGYAGLPGKAGEASVGDRHLLVESWKHAFADRAEWMADPAFVDVPVGMLTSDPYLDVRAGIVRDDRTQPRGMYGTRDGDAGGRVLPDDSGTSHLSVVDRWGGAVACTETINTSFGSMVWVEGAGFCLNNEMDDFTTVRGEANAYGLVQSDRNLPEPGKRPLSSMSPTIVLDGGEVVAVAGASGGPRIITGTMQVLLNRLVHGLDAALSVAAPRLHHQWVPEVVRLERALWRDEPGPIALREGLASRGHEMNEIAYVGVVQLIVREGDGWHAASDPRKGGRPAGH